MADGPPSTRGRARLEASCTARRRAGAESGCPSNVLRECGRGPHRAGRAPRPRSWSSRSIGRWSTRRWGPEAPARADVPQARRCQQARLESIVRGAPANAAAASGRRPPARSSKAGRRSSAHARFESLASRRQAGRRSARWSWTSCTWSGTRRAARRSSAALAKRACGTPPSCRARPPRARAAQRRRRLFAAGRPRPPSPSARPSRTIAWSVRRSGRLDFARGLFVTNYRPRCRSTSRVGDTSALAFAHPSSRAHGSRARFAASRSETRPRGARRRPRRASSSPRPRTRDTRAWRSARRGTRREALALALWRAFEKAVLRLSPLRALRGDVESRRRRARLTSRKLVRRRRARRPDGFDARRRGVHRVARSRRVRAKEKAAIEEAFADGALLVLCCRPRWRRARTAARAPRALEAAHPIRPASTAQMAGCAPGAPARALRAAARAIPSTTTRARQPWRSARVRTAARRSAAAAAPALFRRSGRRRWIGPRPEDVRGLAALGAAVASSAPGYARGTRADVRAASRLRSTPAFGERDAALARARRNGRPRSRFTPRAMRRSSREIRRRGRHARLARHGPRRRRACRSALPCATRRRVRRLRVAAYGRVHGGEHEPAERAARRPRQRGERGEPRRAETRAFGAAPSVVPVRAARHATASHPLRTRRVIRNLFDARPLRVVGVLPARLRRRAACASSARGSSAAALTRAHADESAAGDRALSARLALLRVNLLAAAAAPSTAHLRHTRGGRARWRAAAGGASAAGTLQQLQATSRRRRRWRRTSRRDGGVARHRLAPRRAVPRAGRRRAPRARRARRRGRRCVEARWRVVRRRAPGRCSRPGSRRRARCSRRARGRRRRRLGVARADSDARPSPFAAGTIAGRSASRGGRPGALDDQKNTFKKKRRGSMEATTARRPRGALLDRGVPPPSSCAGWPRRP